MRKYLLLVVPMAVMLSVTAFSESRNKEVNCVEGEIFNVVYKKVDRDITSLQFFNVEEYYVMVLYRVQELDGIGHLSSIEVDEIYYNTHQSKDKVWIYYDVIRPSKKEINEGRGFIEIKNVRLSK